MLILLSFLLLIHLKEHSTPQTFALYPGRERIIVRTCWNVLSHKLLYHGATEAAAAASFSSSFARQGQGLVGVVFSFPDQLLHVIGWLDMAERIKKNEFL